MALQPAVSFQDQSGPLPEKREKKEWEEKLKIILGLKASALLNSKCDQEIKINGGRFFTLTSFALPQMQFRSFSIILS